jgi:hypothetical protein
VLDDIVQEKPFAKSKEQEIDPYEPKQEDKFKSKAINFKDFDDLLIGFEDHPKSNPLADRDNTALFGKVSPEELMISNLETQAGTSNRLNRLMRQKDTGEKMEDIREGDKIADKQVNEEFDTNFSEFMKEYKNEISELPSNKKTEFREAIKDVKPSHRIRRKGLHLTKTVIKPIRGETMPPVIEEIIESKNKKVERIAKENALIAKEKAIQNAKEHALLLEKLHKKRVVKMTKGGFNLPQQKKIESEGSIAPRKKLEPTIIRRNKMPDKIGEDEPAQSKGISKKVLETIHEQNPEPETETRSKKSTLITRPKLATRSKSVEIPKLYPHEIPNVSPKKGPLTEKLTVKIMREMAKEQHIKRYSTMNKSQLIEALSFGTKDFPKFKSV